MSVFITGTPGTGKTTVAEKLAARLNRKLIHLGEFAEERRLTTSYLKDLDTFEVDVAALRDALKEEIREMREVVIEGHVCEAVPSEEVCATIVLRLDPMELEARLKDRGYPPEKILVNVQSEILDICLVNAVDHFGPGKVSEVDTTDKDVGSVVEEVLGVIEGRLSKSSGVDWIGFLMRRGLMRRYFPED